MNLNYLTEGPIDFAQVDLRAKYDEFNARFFDGELPSNIKLGLRKMKQASGQARCKFAKDSGVTRSGLNLARRLGQHVPQYKTVDHSITLSTFLNYDESDFDAVFLHEMIHVWCHIAGYPWENHGRVFQDKATEIGRKAGVEIPLTHKVSYEMASEIKPVGVILVKSETSRGDYLLFDPRRADGFLLLAKDLAQRWRRPVEVYITHSKIWAFMPLARKPTAKKLNFRRMSEKTSEVLSLLDAEQIGSFQPRP